MNLSGFLGWCVGLTALWLCGSPWVGCQAGVVEQWHAFVASDGHSARQRTLLSTGVTSHDDSLRDALPFAPSFFCTTAEDAQSARSADSHSNTSPFQQLVVHVKGPVTSAIRRHLSEHIQPLQLGAYVPHNSFIVLAPSNLHESCAGLVGKLADAPFVLHIRPLDVDAKLHPHLIAHASGTSVSDVLSSRVSLQARARDTHPSTKSVHTSSVPKSGYVELLVRVPEHAATGAHPRSIDSHDQRLARWRRHLGTICRDVSVRAARPALLVVRVPAEHVAPTTRWLQRQGDVEWVEHRPDFKLSNYFAHSLIQDNIRNTTRIYDHGIRGDGQVIAIADTGVDYDSCFFSDPNHPVPVNTVNHDHRKIVTYVEWATRGDEAGGHGTHTAGTLAGWALSTDTAAEDHLGQYNGIAFRSKIASYDIKSPGSGSLTIPEAFYERFYKDSYSAGARQSSCSWGSEDGSYGSYSTDTDRFSYDHPEYLAVYAAGNYGGQDGYFSITSPGMCKNSVSVGSSRSSTASFEELGDFLGIEVTAPSSLANLYKVVPAAFGPHWTSLSEFRLPMVRAPGDGLACDALPANSLKNKIAFVERGKCPFTDKAKNVQAAGAVVFLLADNQITAGTVVMGGDTEGISLPSGTLDKYTGDSMRLWFGGSNYTDAIDVHGPIDMMPVGSPLNENHMSDFSSRGPTHDGRLKPDVLAPGEKVVSARSDGSINQATCPATGGLMDMQGSSMATPMVAASVALLRQYFVQGYYPTGVPISSNSLQPSGALLKAMLVTSGVAVGGTVHSTSANYAVTPPPSYFQGYGRVELGTVMKLHPKNASADVVPSDWKLWVKDRVPMAAGGSHVYCFQVPRNVASTGQTTEHVPTSAFKVSLVWTDPAASAVAAALLINNLDLQVVVTRASSPNTPTIHLGNRLSDSNAQGESVPVADSVNNVEQVTLSTTTANDLISVRVIGKHVPVGPQNYSLVVTGVFTSVATQQCTAHPAVCPDDCYSSTQQGTCQPDGSCLCNPGYTGANCNLQSHELALDTSNGANATSTATSSMPLRWSGSATVNSESWRYFHVDLSQHHLSPNRTYKVVMTMVRLSGNGDPDLYVGRDYMPTLGKFNHSSVVCEPCGKKSSVELACSQVQPVVYYFGVWGYCCQGSTVSVTVDVTEISTCRARSNSTPPVNTVGWVFIAVALVALLTLAGVVWWFSAKCRHRRSGFRQLTPPSGGTQMSANLGQPGPPAGSPATAYSDDITAPPSQDEVQQLYGMQAAEDSTQARTSGAGSGSVKGAPSAATTATAASAEAFTLVDAADQEPDSSDSDDERFLAV